MLRPARTRRGPFHGLLAGICAGLLGVAAITGTAATVLYQRSEDSLSRLPGVFAGQPDRPPRATGSAAGAVNILVLGTDRRSPVPTTGSAARAASWVPGEQRSDTVLLLHIDADRRAASAISIPRDAWVDVPGHGPDKINAAYSYGGPRLAVATVERLTGVRIDHVAVVDWAGFAAITDRLGGVEVTIPATVHDSARDVTWTAGVHRLDGRQALAYVGERYGLPGGDLDRVRRQQAFIRAVVEDSLTPETLASPRLLRRLVDTAVRYVSIDEGWSLSEILRLAASLRHLHSREIDFLTAPVAGTGMVGPQSVVFLDHRADSALWRAVRQDAVGAWTRRHPGLLTPEVVR